MALMTVNLAGGDDVNTAGGHADDMAAYAGEGIIPDDRGEMNEMK